MFGEPLPAAARIPARLRKYETALEKNSFRTVALLRLILWMQQVLHSFLGVSKVRFWTHFWRSFVGYIPPLFMVSYLGSEIFDASGNMQPRALPIMGAMVAASAIILLTVRYYEKRAARLAQNLYLRRLKPPIRLIACFDSAHPVVP